MIIIYPQLNNNNKLAIVYPTGELPIEETAKRAVPEGTPYTIIDTLTGVNSYLLDAYEYHDGNVIPNLNIAKEIHIKNWRIARKPLLEKLDVDYMKALESADTTTISAVVSAKQVLRDVTNTPLSGDVWEIENTWPSCLGERIN